MIPLIMSVLYVWAQFNKDTIVTFWFGTRFKVSHIKLSCALCFFFLFLKWAGMTMEWQCNVLVVHCELSRVTLSHWWQFAFCCRHIIYPGSSWFSTSSLEARKYWCDRFSGNHRLCVNQVISFFFNHSSCLTVWQTELNLNVFACLDGGWQFLLSKIEPVTQGRNYLRYYIF